MITVNVGSAEVVMSEALNINQNIGRAWEELQKYNYWMIPVTDFDGKFQGGLQWRELANVLIKGADKNETTIKMLSLIPCPQILATMPIAETLKLPSDVFAVIEPDGRFQGLTDRARLVSAYSEQTEIKLQQLDAIFDSAHNGILAIDTQGIITSFNPAAEKLSHRTREDAIGKFIADVVVPTGLLDVVRTGLPQFGTKYQVGRKKYITNRTPIFKNGEIVGAVGVFQSISEIEKISAELDSVKELNQQLRSVIDCSYDGILITDSNGIITKGNQAFERITGIALSDIQGKTMDYLLEKGYFANQVVAAVFERKDYVTVIERQTPWQNSLLVTASPVLSRDKQVSQVVINVRDITELNKLRQDLEQTKELSKRYETELNELRGQIMQMAGIVTRSPAMKNILDLAWRVSQVDSTVLIRGESGVGKEVFAKIIHNNSQRRSGPYIKVNCAAIPENLLESELFGYEPGAFTGASKNGKAGLFEIAEKGTIFLDEVGDLSMGLQAKILRVLQERELVRVGGIKPQKIDIRVIAATNQNLEERVREGLFRRDLYYRLNVVPITIPPLRERPEDIIPLLQHFQEKVKKRYHLENKFSPRAIEILIAYNWPGNVREMENMVERLLVSSTESLITQQQVELCLNPMTTRTDEMITVKGLLPLREAVEELEKQLLYRAWKSFHNTYRAAEALQINQSTVVRKLKKFDIMDNI
ncbi:MAG: sigma-54 interaction domain-containing protein [Bacillota bacterium]